LSSKVVGKLKDKPHFLEQSFSRLLPFDHLVVIYSWIILILTISYARPIGNYLTLLAFHAGAIIAVFLLANFVRPDGHRLGLFFRLLYPVILMTFFYQFSGKLVGLVTTQWFDGQVVGWEKALLGAESTLWLDNHLSTFMTEVTSAGYLSYYLLIPGLSLILFFGRRDYEIRRFMTATCVTFFLSYLIFIFYPVEGPRYHLETLYANAVTGTFFRPVVAWIIENEAFRGGAMPSSHVAEALVVAFFAVRVYRRKAWLVIPVVITLAIGTVYGRFHYLSDVVVGGVMAVIICWLTLKLYPASRDYARSWDLTDFDRKRQYVSDAL